jgi:hypothetical protein
MVQAFAPYLPEYEKWHLAKLDHPVEKMTLGDMKQYIYTYDMMHVAPSVSTSSLSPEGNEQSNSTVKMVKDVLLIANDELEICSEAIEYGNLNVVKWYFDTFEKVSENDGKLKYICGAEEGFYNDYFDTARKHDRDEILEYFDEIGLRYIEDSDNE